MSRSRYSAGASGQSFWRSPSQLALSSAVARRTTKLMLLHGHTPSSYSELFFLFLLAAAFGEAVVEHQHGGAALFNQPELGYQLCGVLFFFDLLADEPLQHNLRGVVLFLKCQLI